MDIGSTLVAAHLQIEAEDQVRDRFVAAAPRRTRRKIVLVSLAALTLAGVSAHESVMVGDSYPHDVEGARHVGMRGILVQRTPRISAMVPPDVPVIRDLSELPALVS